MNKKKYASEKMDKGRDPASNRNHKDFLKLYDQ